MKQISLLPIEWKREGAMGGECGDNGTYMKTIRHVNDVSVILAVTKQQEEKLENNNETVIKIGIGETNFLIIIN